MKYVIVAKTCRNMIHSMVYLYGWRYWWC